MKTKYSILIVAFSIVCLAITSRAQSTDAVKKANKSNDEKADKNLVSEDDAVFLVKSADARMMGASEGKLALQKSANASIKKYGQLMIDDQRMLLAKIKSLASKKGISLPAKISDKKEDGREDLAKEGVEDFDKKFVKMMIIDHERDIKLFDKATTSTDPDIRVFAGKYLPLIKSHLEKIEAIKDELK
ncbi:MAG: DUF4142 domain-containing protein [Chryseolinea sp.]